MDYSEIIKQKSTSMYRDWYILEELPDGWSIDKTAGSPAPKTVFITNGKSVLSGQQKRALLKQVIKQDINISKKEIQIFEVKQDVKRETLFPTKTVNILARKKFQEQLLKEIIFDLIVCEIEGWDKKEYIKELRKLLNNIDLEGNKKYQCGTLNLFGFK